MQHPQGQYRTNPKDDRPPMAYVIDRGAATFVTEATYRAKGYTRPSMSFQPKTNIMHEIMTAQPRRECRAKFMSLGLASEPAAGPAFISLIKVHWPTTRLPREEQGRYRRTCIPG